MRTEMVLASPWWRLGYG